MEITVVDYNSEYQKEWDTFIKERACNGCFLQSRKFLSYHPKDRYEDCSLLFYEKNNLVAVCPACVKQENGGKIFLSHAGSTYGGIIVSQEVLRMEKMMIILEMFERYLKKKEFTKCILKQTNPLMCTQKMDLLEFCLYFRKYTEYKELDTYIDYAKFNKADVLSNFSKLKKRLTKKCLNVGMELRELLTRTDMERFLEILTDNLKKYGQKPYHTVDDLIELKRRFPDEIQFWGCIYEGKIVAESMVFLFPKARCAHTHYLAADPDYNKLSPMTYIYYKMVDLYKDKDFTTVSWGITTEHLGVEINHNLTNTKEEFGSKHNAVKIYEKEIL